MAEIFGDNVWENTYLFEKNRRDTEKELFLKDLNIKEAEKRLLKLQIIAGFILIVFMSIVIFLIAKRNKTKQRMNSLLEERNKITNERNYELTLKNKKILDQNIELNYKQEQIKRLLKKYVNKQDIEEEREPEHKPETKIIHNKKLSSIENQIQEAIMLYEKKLKLIRIEKQFEEVPEFYCNKEEMISVWSNLINNSIFAIKTIGTISINISKNNKQIVIKFTDDGQGIDESEFENIFKPFVELNLSVAFFIFPI